MSAYYYISFGPVKQEKQEAETYEIPAWAFRFLQTIPEVTVTLSGMSNFEQLKENIDTFREEKPLTDEEMKGLLGIAAKMLEKKVLPCTACRYCTTHCPKAWISRPFWPCTMNTALQKAALSRLWP